MTMLKIIDEPDYKILFDEAQRVLLVIDSISHYVADSKIKEMINQVADAIIRYKPLYYLGDDSKRKYVFSAAIQRWVAETLLSACIEAGLQKFALVQSEEFIVNLSNEQAAEEIQEENPVPVGFFYTMEEAQNWLGIRL
jgi:16S rRNA U1498 N3-methylase RsmE